MNRRRCSAEGSETSPKIGNNASNMSNHQFQIRRFIEQAALDKSNSVQCGVERETKSEKLTRRAHADPIEGDGRMQMYRHPEPGDVFKDRQELGGVERSVGDIRKDLEALEPELAETAVDLRNRSLRVSKSEAAETDESSWKVRDDLCQIVVDTRGPIVGLSASKHFGAKRSAVAQNRDVDFHVVHGAQFLLHFDDLWQCRHIEPGCTLNHIRATIQDTFGQVGVTEQMLDEIKRLKVCVNIDPHCVIFPLLCST